MTILKGIAVLKDYQVKRDIPSLDATSHLSSHHKFGTVSIREVYHAAVKHLGRDHTLVQELHWRDFFTHIAHHFPYVFGQSFDDRYEQLPWSQDQKRFKAWCDGLTGFPIVDAGMRQLNTTGFMHNRVRMITASFLVKDLHIDWKWGERYFASKLVDYDPAVNNGNWQWAASTGCDHQPYFRIFNPWLQQKRFDPECLYIKKWVEELKDVPVPVIHSWHEEHVWKGAYLKPMVDHSKQAEAAKQMFKMIKGSAED
jgi:deoxyribodipyrimidine photo-lyase